MFSIQEVVFFPLGGNDAGTVAPDRLHCRFGKRLSRYEPLEREHRLDHARAPVAVPDPVLVVLDFYQVAALFQVLQYALAASVAVQTFVRAGFFRHDAALVYHLDEFEAVFAGEFEIVEIVCGRHLVRARSNSRST